LNNMQIRDIAGRISSRLRSRELKDTTLNNLLAEYQNGNDDFYLALDLLAKENKILFLVTPGETYVLPAG
jgi:hypothetical protein